MNRRLLFKQVLAFLFVSPLTRAKVSLQDYKSNLFELIPSLFSLNNEMNSSLRYKISFIVDANDDSKNVYFKNENGTFNILKEDVYFDKGLFYSTNGQVLSIYVRPNTPARIYNREDRSHKFVSDVYLGKIDTSTSTSSVDEKVGSTGKFHKFITPEYFDATGDGITDDTVCINEAIASGYSVFYSARYLISSSISPVNNQKFVGVNNAELILLKPKTSLIKTKGVSDVVIKGLVLTTHPTLSKPYNGSCIEIEGAKGWYIGNNVFSNYGASAIFCRNSSEMFIYNNMFAGSKGAAGDVTLWGSTCQSKIKNNTMLSGSDSAIIIQTIADGDFCSDNLIQDNNIQNCTRYGIVVYNNLSSKKSILRNTKVIGNKIYNILGQVKNPSVHNTKTYGAGIYVLSAENITIQYNEVSKCNLLTNSSTLAPGCIGLNATSNAIVSDNIISDGAYYGIFIGDALQQGKGSNANSPDFIPDGIVYVQRNRIINCKRDGVFIINKHSVIINDNMVEGNQGCGISTSVSNNEFYHSMKNITIANNSSCKNKIGISISDKGMKCRIEDCNLTSNDVGVLSVVPYDERGCAFSKNKLSRKINASSQNECFLLLIVEVFICFALVFQFFYFEHKLKSISYLLKFNC